MDNDALKSAGFSDTEIGEYQKLKSAGFSEDEIGQYYTQQQQSPNTIPRYLRSAVGGMLGGPTQTKIPFIGGYAPAASPLPGIVGAGISMAEHPKLATAAMELGLGAGAGMATAPLGPAISIPAGAGSMAIGSQLGKISEAALAGRPVVEEYGKNILPQAPNDLKKGFIAETAGRALPFVAKPLIKGAGALLKPALGALSGTGKATVETALESGKELEGNIAKTQNDFDKAMRGHISGEEIVDNAKDALNTIKNKRAEDYQKAFDSLTTNKGPKGVIDSESNLISPKTIREKVSNILPKFVRVTNKGKIDWTRSALGSEKSEGVKVLKDTVELLKSWGDGKSGRAIEDRTLKGMDMLKRKLDDMYGETSNARAFIASLRSAVKDAIVEKFPKYAEMTKNYEEATRLIKDIESGALLRKQGISGRITADQTLRRMSLAMKETPALRRDLIGTLGEKGSQNLTKQIAGYLMHSPISGSGPMQAVETIGMFIHPSMWPILIASSPRVQGEFLRVYGKGLLEAGKISSQVYRAVALGGVKATSSDKGKQTISDTLKKMAPKVQGAMKSLDPASTVYASEEAEAGMLPTSVDKNTPDKGGLNIPGPGSGVGFDIQWKKHNMPNVPLPDIENLPKNPPQGSQGLGSFLNKFDPASTAEASEKAEAGMLPPTMNNMPVSPAMQTQQLGVKAYLQGDYPTAIKQYQQAIKMEKDPLKKQELEFGLNKLNTEKTAMENKEKPKGEETKPTPKMASLSTLNGNAYNQSGIQAYRTGDLKGAIKNWELAIRQGSTDKNIPTYLKRARNKMAYLKYIGLE